MKILLLCALLVACVTRANAAGPPTLAGPAMGTTYRVTLGGEIPGLTQGEVHREIETCSRGSIGR